MDITVTGRAAADQLPLRGPRTRRYRPSATMPVLGRSDILGPPDIEAMGRNFDPDYYASEYPDLRLSRDQLFAHFCSGGWFEGRNPGPFFDTTTYLLRYPDVMLADINPLDHYLRYGSREGRET